MGRVVGGANPAPLSSGRRRGPAVRVPFSYRDPNTGAMSKQKGKPSWADAISRISLTGEELVVWYPVATDPATDRANRKRVRASINRSSLRRMARVRIDHDPLLRVLVVSLAPEGANT